MGMPANVVFIYTCGHAETVIFVDGDSDEQTVLTVLEEECHECHQRRKRKERGAKRRRLAGRRTREALAEIHEGPRAHTECNKGRVRALQTSFLGNVMSGAP